MIEVENLSKDFGRTRAVRDVSFRVERGEVVGLLGPNGSGKSTLMRMLTGFFPPNEGRISVAGVDVLAEALRARACIGYLPEHAALYPDMRVDQLLAFTADVRGVPRGEKSRRLDAIVNDCGLIDVRKRLVGNLSKGYRQRVGIAQALLHDPEVVILDEPTVGLDPRQIIDIRQLIRSLGGRTTVLLSTHILPEVASVCDRVIVIDRGRLVAEDSAADLSRRFSGAEKSRIRVAAAASEVLPVVGGVSSVEGVEVEEGGEGPGVSLLVLSSDGDLVRREVAAALCREGMGVLEMSPVSMSLEDLFVRLVTHESEEIDS